MRLAVSVAALALVLAGCAGPLASLRHKAQFATEAGQFRIEYAAGSQADSAEVQAAVKAASNRLARWGTLRAPVTIHLMPSHDLLEEAVNRRGYPWLRAWARYDEIFLQAPRTWSLFGATQRELEELLLHELTHCVMYQVAADRLTWQQKDIPLWFREGLATITAEQGYRWPSLEDLARFYEEHPEVDLVADPDELYRTQSSIVYGAAHHATAFLIRRYGDEKVRGILRSMGAGWSFPAAFEKSIGVPVPTFVAEFERYLKLRGFRGGRLRHLQPSKPPPDTPAPKNKVPAAPP